MKNVINDSSVVVFDADDTIYTFSESIPSIFKRHIDTHNVDSCEKHIENKIMQIIYGKDVPGSGKHNDYAMDKQVAYDFWRDLYLEVASEYTNESATESYDGLYDYYAKAESRTLSPHFLTFINRLRECGKTLGVMSNFDSRVHNVVEELGVTSQVDFIYSSCDIGYRKPGVKFFSTIAEKYNFNPKDIVYIGNNQEEDFYAAREAGWNSILYDTQDKYEQESDKVRCFSELISILK